MWRKDWDALGLESLGDGSVVVAAGGCDFYPGSRASSPSFSFAVTKLRVAGEGDLLAQVERLRRALADEGLFEPQKRLPRPSLPRCIGVVSGEGGKARDDVLAGLRRRGWAGRIVWAFAPVQDRHAAPAITRALQDLAACEEVEVIVVARGGGSLADLFAFCDETLCRTVAMLRVPVISSVGHHTDRTLIDDVAAVACSTPTHAAEAAVPVNCAEARAKLHGLAARLEHRSRLAIVERARALARLSRAPADHVARHRAKLHQQGRELRAAGRRRLAEAERHTGRAAMVLERKASAAAGADRVRARARPPAARAGAGGPRAPADARARLRAGHGPERRAGHLGRRRARADRPHAPPPRRQGLRPPRAVRWRGMTYESACTRIEEVIRRLDSGEAGLRETLELCQEGRRLVEFCAGELDAVAQGLEELRLDELVARLEAGSRPAAQARLNQRAPQPGPPGPPRACWSAPRTPSRGCSSGWPGCRRSTRRRCTSACGRASRASSATTSRARWRTGRDPGDADAQHDPPGLAGGLLAARDAMRRRGARRGCGRRRATRPRSPPRPTPCATALAGGKRCAARRSRR